MPKLAGQAGAAQFRIIDIALDFAGCSRQARKRTIGEENGVPGVLPAMVFQAGLLVAPVILDVAVAIRVAIGINPGKSVPGLPFERTDQLAVARPALALVKQDEEERCGIGRAIAERWRELL